MTIETKYNTGQKVWAKSQGKGWYGEITAISIYYTPACKRIEYNVYVDVELRLVLNESDLFPTKEELLKSL